MKKNLLRRYKRQLPLLLLLVISMVLIWRGSNWALVGAPLVLVAVMVWIVRNERRRNTVLCASPRSHESGESSLIAQTEKEVAHSVERIDIAALSADFRKTRWKEAEKQVDELLDTAIRLVRSGVNANTIAVFFPSADGGYSLRRHDSPSEHINTKAVIYPGVGVIGHFLKDGLKQLNLQEIVTDSMTLYYYTRDAGIRSLMAAPIMAGGIERGTIIVDSTEIKHFSDRDHAYLAAVARLCGEAVYHVYLAREHQLEHLRIASMSTIEKDFFQNLEIDAILDRMIEIIPYAIACDRLTLSLKATDTNNAVVKRVWGVATDGLLHASFSLHDKTLIGLLYSVNMCLYRNFAEDHYEYRYHAGEARAETMQSFCAFPIGIDKCKGAILLESQRKDAFSAANRDLLARLCTSAGLAIEKVQILETANMMATHDGLTGLTNHRQFKKFLRDEMVRCSRYNDPLSMILCDIDHFKKVNDTHGHQFGDVVLKEVAARLMSSVRESVDCAARYGGEEFALVLVKTDAAQALDKAERIRKLIAEIPFKTPSGGDMRATLSFGIATLSPTITNGTKLIEHADKALYRAKENGRNRVEVY